MCSYDIRGLPFMTSAPRGEGVQKSADFVDKQFYCGADKGGGGSKIPKILRTSFMYGPSWRRHGFVKCVLLSSS